ncbi:unnamed protein product [Gadus morhua 'NCC']
MLLSCCQSKSVSSSSPLLCGGLVCQPERAAEACHRQGGLRRNAALVGFGQQVCRRRGAPDAVLANAEIHGDLKSVPSWHLPCSFRRRGNRQEGGETFYT